MAMQVERAREAFEVQASYFRDVLAIEADSFVGFERSVGARILTLKSLELSAYPRAGETVTLSQTAILLPSR